MEKTTSQLAKIATLLLTPVSLRVFLCTYIKYFFKINTTVVYIGDGRAQDNPQLAITHTLFVREHNRLARELKQINPHWDSETLFQETRRIVVAELQHITYNEYLPVMLGMLR